jgi:hypothetical protein
MEVVNTIKQDTMPTENPQWKVQSNPTPFTICQPADGATSEQGDKQATAKRHGGSAQLLAKSQAHLLEASGFVARAISLLPVVFLSKNEPRAYYV